MVSSRSIGKVERSRSRSPARLRMADWKPPAFVERDGRRIEINRRIPEATHHLHLAGMVPDIGGNDAARARGSSHFADSLRLIRYEIDDQGCDHRIEGIVVDRQRPRVTDPEHGAIVTSRPPWRASAGSRRGARCSRKRASVPLSSRPIRRE